MNDDRDDRIEFGDLGEDFEAETYPLSAEELLDRYGDRRLEHADGSWSLRELLDEGPERTFGSADDVRRSVRSDIDDADGGEDDTDRVTSARGDDFEQQSS